MSDVKDCLYGAREYWSGTSRHPHFVCSRPHGHLGRHQGSAWPCLQRTCPDYGARPVFDSFELVAPGDGRTPPEYRVLTVAEYAVG